MLKIMSKFSATLVIMLLITLSPIFQYQVSAHATLEKSTPQQQGIIKHKPEVIKLEFNEPVNTKYSSVTLFDDKGKKIKDYIYVHLTNFKESYTMEGYGDENPVTKKYNRKEFNYNSFTRTFTLPDSADQSKINAEYTDGILFIKVAKKEEAKIQAREISVK